MIAWHQPEQPQYVGQAFIGQQGRPSASAPPPQGQRGAPGPYSAPYAAAAAAPVQLLDASGKPFGSKRARKAAAAAAETGLLAYCASVSFKPR